MSYYHWHHGPRRFVWFFIGAATATWWIKAKEAHHGQASWSHCIRPPLQSLPASPNPDAPWTPRDIPRTINSIPPAESWSDQQSQTKAQIEEKDRMAALGNQAGDKMVELSEATLDTVLTTVEMLKAKLAEHRAEREKQLEEDRKRNPPRLV
ncbi:hypothetical protein BDZ94DRAFT_1251991 [Collybia nuda]|uniref:Uncharacterized protein n=1 Tax=Collybia nuda TaxID=64659 RepID=A0A9P5YB61_9AGAR|nr:hypothetical protein BDZ94DRAFT_1251991 [Collybia nuda]